MKKLGTNFAIFILFFGVASIEAVQSQNWPMVFLWTLIALVFLREDLRKS